MTARIPANRSTSSGCCRRSSRLSASRCSRLIDEISSGSSEALTVSTVSFGQPCTRDIQASAARYARFGSLSRDLEWRGRPGKPRRAVGSGLRRSHRISRARLSGPQGGHRGAYRNGAPSVRFTVEHQFGEGDFVATRLRAEIIHRGNTITVRGINISRWEGDRLAEEWAVWETFPSV